MSWECQECGRSFTRRPARHSCVRTTVAGFLGDDRHASRVYRAVLAFLRTLGPVEEDATPTQVGWRVPGGSVVAWFWLPYRVLKGRPAVPVVCFTSTKAMASARVKESSRAGPGRWTNHMVVANVGNLDAAAKELLRAAYRQSTRALASSADAARDGELRPHQSSSPQSARRPSSPNQSDPEGFDAAVRRFVRRIPKGRVSTYGDVAEAVGRPGAARAVGRVMTMTPEDDPTPCHRVVRADGYVADGGQGTLAGRLRKEGIVVDAEGRIPGLASLRWP